MDGDQDDEQLLDDTDDDGVVDVELGADEPSAAESGAEWPTVAQPGGGAR